MSACVYSVGVIDRTAYMQVHMSENVCMRAVVCEDHGMLTFAHWDQHPLTSSGNPWHCRRTRTKAVYGGRSVMGEVEIDRRVSQSTYKPCVMFVTHFLHLHPLRHV